MPTIPNRGYGRGGYGRWRYGRSTPRYSLNVTKRTVQLTVVKRSP